MSQIINAIKLCLESNTFTFNNKIYTQIRGVGIGCNLSPVVAECLVGYIFDKAIAIFIIILIILIYDSFIIINKRFSDQFFRHFYDIGKQLQTINEQICFLDIKIHKNGNKLKTCVYRKPTHSNRYLNFNSHHSMIIAGITYFESQ